ncbi:hypothetical protein OH76DRAFT_1423986 [Lentinus brumalis]|uniref:Uncharacterized protein n=1 Tax=Lentinus brumalis TaxID=2498619 RepID=A0A371CI52_9APHY|nr:hypothetical protein OH76DRAFT_1423986 [Polyporus brumalis]
MHPWGSAHVGSQAERERVFRRPLSPAMEQARHYADTGKVCIGPIGAPVSGKDRKMLQVIQELEPLLMKNWFEGSYGAKFYTSKFQLDHDASLAKGPHYVLFRSLIGSAVLSDWNEVAPAVIGVPGSLFQKCSSFLEASLRFAQAHMIGGIIYQIPESVVGATTTDEWIEAFACSPLKPLYIPKRDYPMLGPVPPCTMSDVPDEVLDAEDVGEWWQTFLPGRKPAHDYSNTYFHSSPCIVTTPLQAEHYGRDPPPSPSSTLSWESGFSCVSSARAMPRDLPVLAPPISACGDPVGDIALPRTFRSFQAGGSRGAIRPDQGGVAELWLPETGSGNVAYYATFREALDGFRDALTVGRVRVL